MRLDRAEVNADWLRARFLGLLLAESPTSVLDVGCGADAHLLVSLGAAGVPAVGVESGKDLVEAQRERGLDVHHADAAKLPFDSGSFGWVTLRHVPHHVADERPPLAEALRVAQRGVLVAEPWFDPSVPSQRVAAEVDSLIKELHRRQGRIHRPNLDAGQLTAGLTEVRPDVGIEVYAWRRLSGWPPGALDAELEPLLAAVGGAGDRAACARLREVIDRDGLSRNGSIAVLARLPD